MVEGLEVGLRTWVEDGQGHQMEDDLGGRGQADGSLIGEDLAEAIRAEGADSGTQITGSSESRADFAGEQFGEECVTEGGEGAGFIVVRLDGAEERGHLTTELG